jgi:hypothetical protein
MGAVERWTNFSAVGLLRILVACCHMCVGKEADKVVEVQGACEFQGGWCMA